MIVEGDHTTVRPELQEPLHMEKVTGAALVIAMLDRLSRNAAFLPALRDSGGASSPSTCRKPTTSRRHHGADPGMLTRLGGRWHVSNVRNLRTRLAWLFRSKAPPNDESRHGGQLSADCGSEGAEVRRCPASVFARKVRSGDLCTWLLRRGFRCRRRPNSTSMRLVGVRRIGPRREAAAGAPQGDLAAAGPRHGDECLSPVRGASAIVTPSFSPSPAPAECGLGAMGTGAP